MNIIGLYRHAALVGLACAAPFAVSAQVPNAQAILTAADRIRVPQRPFRMDVTLTDYVNGRAAGQIDLAIRSKLAGGTREFLTLIKYVRPPRDAGKVVLFNGTNLWFYDPVSKAVVRISPQQRLIGQAANGDVVTTNLANDYKATLVGAEAVVDSDRKSRSSWRLNLLPARKSAIYGRIELWVERGSSAPIKGKFYADSGRLLKVAYYARYRDVLGAQRPTETIIIDAVDSKAVTILSSARYAEQNLPDLWFQRDYLPQVR